ncbi:hypothetical protein BGW37DRAFT_477101 [Umbelopsis sp. PMI_123]|nr:hypothetical protein BGW37DRAFT_477101 [Umbelopsis sp. PMI_123]
MANGSGHFIPTFSIRSRFAQLIIVVAVVLNLGFVLYYWTASGEGIPSSTGATKDSQIILGESGVVDENSVLNLEESDGNEPTRKKVAVLNYAGAHDEVVVSVLYTLAQIPEYDVDVFFTTPRYGIEQIMAPFYSQPLKNPHSFGSYYDSSAYPDVIIMASCDGSDIYYTGEVVNAMVARKPDMKVMCIVHNPQVLQDVQLRILPLVQKGAVTMVGLSPHVVDYLKDHKLPDLAKEFDPIYANVPTGLFVPTFDYRLPDSCATADNTEKSEACRTTFVVQGIFETGRRDYNSLFDRLQDKVTADEEGWNDFHLLLLGQGSPFDLKEPLASHVSTFNDLPYLDYYDKIHHSLALLPAFASDSYLLYKASSSVGASLLTGVPLIADQALLDSYRHLTKDGVYFQNDGEHFIDTVERIRKLSVEEMNEKRANASAMNRHIIEGNIAWCREL